jgi:hypothetical protein
MLKFSGCFVFIFFFYLHNPILAQDRPPSQDTNTVSPSGQAEQVISDTIQANTDNAYQPIADSSFIATDSLRSVPHKQVLAYTMNPDYAYANDPGYWKREPVQKPGPLLNLFASRAFQGTLFIGIIVLVLYGIYLLVRENNFTWLYRSGKQNRKDLPEMLQEEELDYDQLVQQYQSEQNYRMAVRYMYLRLIHTAREKNIIQIRDSSTNAEITRAFGTSLQQDEFHFLANAYDYIFYGGFIPGQELFNLIKSRFDVFQQKLAG